jgi:hypothetical protein
MNSNTRVRAQAESTTDNIEAGIVALFSSRVMSLVSFNVSCLRSTDAE